MARRKQSVFEDLIELAALLPWWMGAILAIVAYLVIHPFAIEPLTPATVPGELGRVASGHLIRTLATLGQYIVPAAFLIGAAVSAIGRMKRKRLFETTAEVARPHAAKSMSWREFEMLVGEVFRRKGYTVRETAQGADGGVDLELQKDGELYLVQCKHWRATKVGVPTVRELFGVMAARGAVGAFVVTSGVYTKEARTFAEGRNIELIDGGELDRLIRQVKKTKPAPQRPGMEIGMGDTQRASAKAERSMEVPDCPLCNAPMVRRMARKGAKAGSEFWGCSNYPKCRGTRPIVPE